MGNYIKRARKRAFQVGGETTKLFAEGNVLEGSGELIGNLKPVSKAEAAFPVAAVATDLAPQAFQRVLASSGATLPQRDPVDQRVVKQVIEGTGGLIDSQGTVGGWPALPSVAPPADVDQDGMPDAWERCAGLNPKDPADAAGDPDRDGYTNVEEWLNGTDPKSPLAACTSCLRTPRELPYHERVDLVRRGGSQAPTAAAPGNDALSLTSLDLQLSYR